MSNGGKLLPGVVRQMPSDSYSQQFMTTDLVMPAIAAAGTYWFTRKPMWAVVAGTAAYVYRKTGQHDIAIEQHEILHPMHKPLPIRTPIVRNPVINPIVMPHQQMHGKGIPDDAFFHAINGESSHWKV